MQVTSVRMDESEESLRWRQLHSIAEVHHVRHLERCVVRLVSFSTGANLVVQFRRLNRSKEGCVTTGYADSIIYKNSNRNGAQV